MPARVPNDTELNPTFLEVASSQAEAGWETISHAAYHTLSVSLN